MNNISEEYYQALSICSERYSDIISDKLSDDEYWGNSHYYEQLQKLRLFNLDFKASVYNRDPLMKLNRWLGYIQGTLIAYELTTVQAERDFTRPLFQRLDFY